MVLPTIAVLVGLVAVILALLRDPPLGAVALVDERQLERAEPVPADAPPHPPAVASPIAAPQGQPVVHREDPEREALRTEAALRLIEERRR